MMCHYSADMYALLHVMSTF